MEQSVSLRNAEENSFGCTTGRRQQSLCQPKESKEPEEFTEISATSIPATTIKTPATEWNFVVLKNERRMEVQNPQQMVLIFNKVSARQRGEPNDNG